MNHPDRVAIVGIGGVFPGAGDLAQFWQNIHDGVDGSREVPPGRWLLDRDSVLSDGPADDRVYSLRACFLDAIPDVRDAELALPADFDRLDPLVHLLIAAGKQAFDDAVTSGLDRQRVGVVVGNIALPTDMSSAWAVETLGRTFAEQVTGVEQPSQFETHPLNRFVNGLPAGILATALGLGGGTVTLDAACASSLYAVKLAADELLAGRADAMLTGGVSRPDSLYTQMGFSRLRALSASGHCSPFDYKADGLVVGEGAGIVVLKRLSDALRDGDHIYATIAGIGLSNDVGGNLLAPDSEGQLRAMRQAYEQAGWKPEDIELIECHGTGTPVGDAVEFSSLCQLWQNASPDARCVIGSVKSNVGHLLTGAGAAGLIKVLLAMKHGVLPPTANFERPNEKLSLEGSPFAVLNKPREWVRRTPTTPRRAAISAFGFGGINAHVLIEEWLAPTNIGVTILPVSPPSSVPIAIVGAACQLGAATDLPALARRVLGNESAEPRGNGRWWGVNQSRWFHKTDRQSAAKGYPIRAVSVGFKRFRIPPLELREMLPQQLLMLQIAADAFDDAYAHDRKQRLRTGVFIGIGLDLNTTNFHFRWWIRTQARQWAQQLGISLDEEQLEQWVRELRDAAGPALSANRTMGALGGVVASRIAREFRIGGPSFTISCEECSGLRALDIAVRCLQNRQIDDAIVGGVDFATEVRAALGSHALQGFSRSGVVRPFDAYADGTLPGDGAVALILKRYDDAVRDGDKIYATIHGIGTANADDLSSDALAWAYVRSMRRAYDEAGVAPAAVELLEANASGDWNHDTVELQALEQYAKEHPFQPTTVSSSKSAIGHTGAASGLVSLLTAALALKHRLLPAVSNVAHPRGPLGRAGKLAVHRDPRYWLHDRAAGPRVAGVSSVSTDGNCMHVVLSEPPADTARRESTISAQITPVAPSVASDALFVIEGDDHEQLVAGLERLEKFIGSRTQEDLPVLAALWWRQRRKNRSPSRAVSLVAADRAMLHQQIQASVRSLQNNPNTPFHGSDSPSLLPGIRDRMFYSPDPLGIPLDDQDGLLAFVFPGSGSHFSGMGRDLGLYWPEIFAAQEEETGTLCSQWQPELIWNLDQESLDQISPRDLILAQVSLGTAVHDLICSFGVKPTASIGYSLGETTALFATRAWRDRDEMLQRLRQSSLFSEDLAGSCWAARKAWNVSETETVRWSAGVVDRPAEAVRRALPRAGRVYLLMINTPGECVIGGDEAEVEHFVERLGCRFFPLTGVSTVHCEIVRQVEQEYRQLHLLPTQAPEGLRYYSSAWARSYQVTEESAADAILANAVQGADFPTTIQQAYEDGVRIFVEMGPGSSCSRMIGKILQDKPHFARSACIAGQDARLTIIRLLGGLVAERVPVDLARLYDPVLASLRTARPNDESVIVVPTGGDPFVIPAAPSQKAARPAFSLAAPANEGVREAEQIVETAELSSYRQWQQSQDRSATSAQEMNIPPPVPTQAIEPPKRSTAIPAMEEMMNEPSAQEEVAHFASPLLQQFSDTQSAAAQAHAAYLQFDQQMTQLIGEQLSRQFLALQGHTGHAVSPAIAEPEAPTETVRPILPGATPEDACFMSRAMCLEYATGSIARVLGEQFAAIDAYPTRVRLPDEPLMLADRIVSVEGEPGSLTSGRVVTEHDVLPAAWYLDGNRIPTCIAVEAGQADLFLSGYLGIDFKTKGMAVYRLLDAVVTFHSSLPQPGKVIRYDIRIERFFRQGDTYLFRFNFDSTVDGRPLLTMRDGCAGFFTNEELQAGRGIVHTKLDKQPRPGKLPPDWQPLVKMSSESYDAKQLDALRRGDLAGCFGPAFESLNLNNPIRLPGGRMTLIHRVTSLDPNAGRFGLGQITAEADIYPDDWFLTCHFVDDRVMPGTLMYECCLHTLRVFLMRMGWVGNDDELAWEPVPGVSSRLKCRGQVIESTKTAAYEVTIKELGYGPEPYAIADALMYADGKPIVEITDMSVRLSGATRNSVETLWKNAAHFGGVTVQDHSTTAQPPAIYGKDRILAFAIGKPSEAFGEPYRIFDSERVIARLPGPPYQFLDRITALDAEPWKMVAGGTVEGQYDVPPDAWYFAADRQPTMPFAVLLEVGLQVCGWLAAYIGSALTSDTDLSFRNLGGQAEQFAPVGPDAGTLTTWVKITKVSSSGGMIIQNYDFVVRDEKQVVYRGDTYFGFFSKQALAQQIGVREAKMYELADAEKANAQSFVYPEHAPFPDRQLRMVDSVDIFVPDGGPHGLGYIRGSKPVDPDEWFFKAHFYQDPVNPGSLGLESFLQLLKFVAAQRWQAGPDAWFVPVVGADRPHRWIYRGQVIPMNKRVTVEAVITAIDDARRMLRADGLLAVDGRIIYQMNDFTLTMFEKPQ